MEPVSSCCANDSGPSPSPCLIEGTPNYWAPASQPQLTVSTQRETFSFSKGMIATDFSWLMHPVPHSCLLSPCPRTIKQPHLQHPTLLPYFMLPLTSRRGSRDRIYTHIPSPTHLMPTILRYSIECVHSIGFTKAATS